MAGDALAVLTRIGHAPLIGRDEERKLLASRLISSVSPPGAVLVVSGEPGSGKTRLALEAASDAARQGARLLSLRCYQETGTLPYAPFADLSDSVPEVVHVLTHGADATGSRSAEGARLGLFERVDQLLTEAAGEAAHVLFVDDLHWADAASLDLLRHLARRGRRGRRALIVTVRSGEARAASPVGRLLADFAREGHYLEIPVGALTPEACSELLSALLGDVDTALAAAVYARSEGVPFVVEELVRQFAAGGLSALAHSSGGPGFDLPIPLSVASALVSRVEQLPEECRRAVRASAVLGATCTSALLAGILDLPARAVEEDLEPALAARLLLSFKSGSETEYAFAHVLQRDAIYADLPPHERRSLHQAAAHLLASPSLGTGDTPWALVAFHAERARDWQLTYSASVSAGDTAMAGLAGTVALAHFRRARSLADRARVSPGPAERTALDRRIVQALISVGHMEAAVDEARALAATAERHEAAALAAWALIHLGQASTLAHKLDEAENALQRGLALAESLGDVDLRAAALANLGVLLDKRGELDAAEERLREALTLAGGPRNNALTLLGYIYTGYLAYWRGNFAFAVERLRDALRLAEVAHDALSLASARFCLALALGSIGGYEEALAHLHTLLDFTDMTGEPYYAARVPNSIGWIYRELGLYERAAEWDERAVAETATGDWPGLFEARANSLLNLASDLIALDRLSEVDAILGRAAHATEHDEFMRWRNSNRLLLCRAELALAHGDGEGALRRSEEALARADETRISKYAGQAHYLAGQALSLSGDQTAALSRFEQALAISTSIGHTAGQWRILASMSTVLRLLGRPEEAAVRHSEAWRVIEDIAAGLRDQASREAFLASAAVLKLSSAEHLDPMREQSTGKASRLTLREVEVLRCVARGLTNREIASALTISERTVNSHLVHIFDKLQVNSRAAATAHALRLGLAI